MTKQKEKKCKCGKLYLVYPYRYKEAKFCSMICQRKYRQYGQNKGLKIPKGSFAKKGNKNGMWNKIQDNASKSAIHDWIRRRIQKTQVCEFCREDKKLELANMNDHIHRRDVNDYKWLCRKCHIIYDKRIKNLKLAPNHLKSTKK